jgi:hypothetical protein
VARVAKLTSAVNDAALAGWLGPLVNLAELKKNMTEVAAYRGSCIVDKVLEGDGRTKARVALVCARAPATLTVELDDATGKVTSIKVDGSDPPLGKCAE